MKTCKVCGERKPFTEFYAMKGMRDGYRNECKACFRAKSAERYRANPELAKERARRWQRENKEKHADYMRRYRASGRRAEVDRRSYLKRTYGITPELYDEMLEAQDGTCGICRRRPRDDISLHVDHDHERGLLRGLLCFKCNNALGDFGDDIRLLKRAVSYLLEHDPAEIEAAVLTKQRLAALTN